MRLTSLLLCSAALSLLACRKEPEAQTTEDQIFRVGAYDTFDYHRLGDTSAYILNPAQVEGRDHRIDLDGDQEADIQIESGGIGAYQGTSRRWVLVRPLGNQWAMAKRLHQESLRECLDIPNSACKRRIYTDNWNRAPCQGTTDRAAGSRIYHVPLRYEHGDLCAADEWTTFTTNNEDRELHLYDNDEDWDYNNQDDQYCHEIYNLYYGSYSQEHYWLFKKTVDGNSQYAWLKLKLEKEYPDVPSSPHFKLRILEVAYQGVGRK